MLRVNLWVRSKCLNSHRWAWLHEAVERSSLNGSYCD